MNINTRKMKMTQRFKIGDIVYEMSIPQNPGKVIKVLGHKTITYPNKHGSRYTGTVVRVRWMNMKQDGHRETDVPETRLCSYALLVESKKHTWERAESRMKKARML